MFDKHSVLSAPSRRTLLWGSALLVTEACRRKKGTGYSGFALIATAGENTLAVVDLLRFRLIRSIPLGAAPSAIRVSDDRGYALTPATGSVHMVSADLDLLASKRFADQLSEIRLSPDGKTLVALARGARELIVIDAHTLSLVRRHRLENEPFDLDVSAGSRVAVSSGAAGIAELIDLTTGQHTKTQLSAEIGAIRFRYDGNIVLVANYQGRSLFALDVPGLQAIVELPLAMKPENLCFSPDHGQLFVSGNGMDAVAIVFPYHTLEVEQTVLAGRTPGVMACSDAFSYLFVANRDGSNVCILSVQTRKMIGIVEVGQAPDHITITPDDQYALVLDRTSGDMAVIHIPAIRGNRQKSGAALFTMIPVGDTPVDAAIINSVNQS